MHSPLTGSFIPPTCVARQRGLAALLRGNGIIALPDGQPRLAQLLLGGRQLGAHLGQGEYRGIVRGRSWAEWRMRRVHWLGIKPARILCSFQQMVCSMEAALSCCVPS